MLHTTTLLPVLQAYLQWHQSRRSVPQDGHQRGYRTIGSPTYSWKKKSGRLGTSGLHRLKQLEAEGQKLKKLVAELSQDKHMLQEVKYACRYTLNIPPFDDDHVSPLKFHM